MDDAAAEAMRRIVIELDRLGQEVSAVRHVLDVMKADIDTALGLTGQTSIADVDRSALYETGAVAAPSR